MAPTTKRWGWAVFFMSQKAQIFSIGNHRRVLGTWFPGQAGEKASFQTPLRDDFFLYLQIWPLPASRFDPGAATWHVSTRGHVGHFLLLCTKRQRTVSTARPFQNGILHWPPWPLSLFLECRGMGNWAARSRAGVTEPLLQHAELCWCDTGFCLQEGLNVSVYGAMTLWFPRLVFQTRVCAHMCPSMRETHTCAHAHCPHCPQKKLYPHRPTP